MELLLSLLVFFYFFSVCLFLFNSHCIFYCLLLVCGCLLSSSIVYLVLGFSWYSLLLCLVYVGGVYILFVFVSVQSPNSIINLNYTWLVTVMITISVVYCWWVCHLATPITPIESSVMLCTQAEGWFYVCLCLTLLFGFLVISVVMSNKPNFYR